MNKVRNLPVITLVAIVGLAMIIGFLLLTDSDDSKTVSARFPRAVSVFPDTEVRILGVKVGRVSAVVPDGNAVRVDMEYDAKYKIPAAAQAAIVTPTLVSDRFVQLTPAYSEGPAMKDGAEIDVINTGVPVELDRIYAALQKLTVSLGPNGVNKNGTLNNLLQAGQKSLQGNGVRGNAMFTELSKAAQTFGEGSGDLFATVEELAGFTGTLADNDRIVRAFTQDLANVSEQLAGEREELEALLAALADSVGTVETFVRNNRGALKTDVQKLSRVLKTVNSERESLDTALATGPVAIGNLVLAYNTESGSIGSRIGVQGRQTVDFDGFLCTVVQQSQLPEVSKDLSCEIFEQILEAEPPNLPDLPGGGQLPGGDQLPFRERQPSIADIDPDSVELQKKFATEEQADLFSLLGGSR